MAVKIQITPIVPKGGLFNIGALRNARSQFFAQKAREVVEQLNRPIQADWDVKVNSDGFTVSTTTPKYVYINDGTSIRYATMTPNFVSKTRRGSLARGPGGGAVAYVNKKVPRRGIEARNFVGVVQKTLPDNLSREFGLYLARRVVRF